MNSAAVSTPSIRTSTETPFQVVSSFDHLVTQWMSLVTISDGSAANSFHVQRFGWSISPSIEKVHWSRLTRGVGRARRHARTGRGVPALDFEPSRDEPHQALSIAQGAAARRPPHSWLELDGDDAKRGCAGRQGEGRSGQLVQRAAVDRETADRIERRVDDVEPGA